MITDDDIRRVMSHRAFEAGLEYQMDGRVHDLRTKSDGTTIQARVKGSGRATYEQTILLVRGPKGRLLPSGSCSCPVGFNCKHVAAVLLEYQEQAALAPGMGGPHQQNELPRAGQLTHRIDAAANTPSRTPGWMRWQASGWSPTIRLCRCCCRSRMAGC